MTEVTVFMDEKFGFLNKIDIDAVVKSREDLPWFNQTLCSVNDCVVHRTRAPERAVFLMAEGSGVTPTGD